MNVFCERRLSHISGPDIATWENKVWENSVKMSALMAKIVKLCVKVDIKFELPKAPAFGVEKTLEFCRGGNFAKFQEAVTSSQLLLEIGKLYSLAKKKASMHAIFSIKNLD